MATCIRISSYLKKLDCHMKVMTEFNRGTPNVSPHSWQHTDNYMNINRQTIVRKWSIILSMRLETLSIEFHRNNLLWNSFIVAAFLHPDSNTWPPYDPFGVGVPLNFDIIIIIIIIIHMRQALFYGAWIYVLYYLHLLGSSIWTDKYNMTYTYIHIFTVTILPTDIYLFWRYTDVQ